MVTVLGLGNRHPPSADIVRRSDTSGSIANPRPAPSPTEQTRRLPAPDSSDSGGLHFFSLPHWTRRILPVSSPARKSFAGLPHADECAENPGSTSPRRLLLEKDLPPTPSSLADANITSRKPSAHLNDARVSIAVQHMTDTPPQPTSYLDVYHNTPIVSPPSQINSIAFTSFPDSSAENVLRKSKSTHLLRPDNSLSGFEKQRTRGVSVTQMFTTAKQASASPCTTNGNSPTTPLVRKSSFWSRKLSTSSPKHLTVPVESPSLPAVNLTSPLRVDFTAPPDSLVRSCSKSSSTSRRRSERAVRHSSTARTYIPSLPQSPVAPDRTNVRPSTADPCFLASHRSPVRRPATADSVTASRSCSLFALSHQSTVPPSNNEPFPASLTLRSEIRPSNPRPRSSTNPQFLHRLSVNLFASSPLSATKSGPSFPNGVASSPTSRSPRPSLSQIPPDVLKPRAGESAENFVNRLVSLVSKAEIAGVLASAGDPLYADSLKLFIECFGFQGDPLDVALRRLLMDVGLPRETQQIDRVIEAFANRYLSCNPDLFTSRDHPYILAFSLIMLHTDVFNKSNRRKMSKADYMRNTTLPGLIPEVLDCFYDNIVFAPFIFIEDPLDPEGNVERNITRPSTSSGLPSPMIHSGNTLLSRPKIDPYYLITNNLLDQLRVDVEGKISLENPFRWDGTGTSWNYDEIFLAFAKGHVVQIGLTEMRPTAFFGLSVKGNPSSSFNGLGGGPEALPASETWTIKLTKVAVLNRKDELLEGGKKPLNRKWRPQSVALTRSQLLLFRDVSWSSTLLSWNDPPRKPPISSTSLKPDEIISLHDALAVLDRSYSKHLNTFRLTTRDGRHILFQTTEQKEMNEWISRINYASAFKTTGIRMRSLEMTSKVLKLTGVAAATSHLHDLQFPNFGQPRMLTWDHRNLSEPMDEPPGYGGSHTGYSTDTDGCGSELADLSAPEIEGASQFKETFDTVKAELAAARISAGDLSVMERAYPVEAEPPRLASRSHMIHTHVEDLENRICAANAQIDSSIHVARNIWILTPFQKSTRERLQDTIQTMSKKIQAMRLHVTKLICHRNVLLNDLAAEERNFKQATSLALQAATETLQQRHSEYTSQSPFSTQEVRPMTLFHEETPPTASQSFDTSTYETLRSALDFGPDWPSSGEAFAAPSLWGPSLVTDSPVTQGCDSPTGFYPSLDETSYLSLSTTNQSLPDTSLHENLPAVPDFSEEQAEEWHKTRAAKRVSLVKLPSDLRMSTIAGKSSRHLEGNDLLKEELSTVGGVGHRT